ncbi:MAG: urea ABC transporter permease subunit UrtB [Opitutales bacterium]
MRQIHIVCVWIFLIPFTLLAESRPTREILEDLVLAVSSQTQGFLEELSQSGDSFVKEFVDSWRTGEVYLWETREGKVVLHKVSEAYHRVSTNELLDLNADEIGGLSKARPSRELRKALKTITDTIDLVSPIESVRIDAVRKLGLSGDVVYLPLLERRFEVEESKKVRRTIEEVLLVHRLKTSVDPGESLQTVKRLGKLRSFLGKESIENVLQKALADDNDELVLACKLSLRSINNRQTLVNQLGNLFRGLSLGSVLLMVSFGLAITFGLMGIINMAHGEFIAIGGYTCYIVQNLFASWFGVQSAAYQWFFIVSLPVSFLVAGVIGLGFEKAFIRFLYRRPLESLLATWGLSMVLQQVYRLVFGAANVQVYTPDFLMGSFEIGGAFLSYTRLFVIGFALLIVVATWLLLAKTKLGLYIRAVMQNRQMAASLGIPVSRVNSVTFAFGCGLASLAGAVLSQIGNVGPSVGQAYIVDSFMVVVAGSVGNLLGAGISAMGIGVVDQFLQPTLGPVMGKITVFAVIIIFLQWRPGGLFPAKSRSLED